MDERVESLTNEIEVLSDQEAHCVRLKSIPAIGPIISTATVSAIGTGEAFDRGRDFAAWIGLVPRQHSTGGKPILGRMSKRGSKYLRTLFIQAAHILLMRPENWKKFSFGTLVGTGHSTPTQEQARRGAGQQAGPDRVERSAAWQDIRHPPR